MERASLSDGQRPGPVRSVMTELIKLVSFLKKKKQKKTKEKGTTKGNFP
jgi:hypothetical protein